MALTESERSDVRRWLGYADRISGDYHVLENAMDTLKIEAEASIRQSLDRICIIDDKLIASLCRFGVESVDDIKLSTSDMVCAMYQEGNRQVQLVASSLGVPIERLPFGVGQRGTAERS